MSDQVWPVEPGKGIGILTLGASRDEVLRRVAAAGFTAEEEEQEPHFVYVLQMDAELTFSQGPALVLEEIAISDEGARLGPLELIDEPIHKIIELMKIVDAETVWTLRPDEAEKTDGVDPAAVLSPEKLLTDGTLWIRPFGLGLDLLYGDILTVRVRRPGDVPERGFGSLTPEQRAVAANPKLSSHLLGEVDEPPRPTSRFQLFGCLGVMLGLALVIWQAIDYQRRWNASPLVEGEVVAVKPPPPEPFPDEYTIVYHDTEERRHEVVLRRADVYGMPKIGGKVELRYLPEAPDEPLGPARVPDAWADKYLLWGIGIVAGYFVLQLVVPIVRWAARSKA